MLLMPDDFEPDEVPEDSTDDGYPPGGLDPTPMPLASRPTNPSIHPDHIGSLSFGQREDRSFYGDAFLKDTTRPLPPRYMFTGSLDNIVRLLDTATGVCLRRMFGHVEGVWAMAGSTMRVVTGANDSIVKAWEPRSGTCELTIARHSGPGTFFFPRLFASCEYELMVLVTSVAVSDRCMASGSEDGEVLLYSFECHKEHMEECGTPA